MRLVFLVTLATCVCRPALAQDRATPAAADDPDTERARGFYESGARHYAAGQYREAIADFEKARQLKAAPGLDFNIARSYDRLGETEQAMTAYRRYLDSNPSDADEVRARVAILEERTAKEAAAAKTTPTTPASTVPPEHPKRRTWVYVVSAVAAVAVVGVAVGVGVGVGAKPSDPMPQQGVIHW